MVVAGRDAGETGGRRRAGGQRLDVESVAGHEQVEAVGVAGEALVGPAELVAVQASEGVLGDDPEPDLVGDGDEGDTGLGDGVGRARRRRP